ncbi:pericentrin isoform X3 [Rhineura floridana]|uniref:pericentrin isoform X3 n=1 Tax=Rhineura floridana TaxID=261503 RepID=UPI002AC87933|nr:pericentrin isoform X3 [Rhineura floridana]
MEDFLKKCSEIDLKYSILAEERILQVTKAEERAREVEESKCGKRCLNEEIEKLNSFIQELNDKLLFEKERNKDLSCKYAKEISVYSMKLKDLEEEKTLLLEVCERQKTKLEETQSKLCQCEEELQLVGREKEFPHGCEVDALINLLEDTKQNLNKDKAAKDTESLESDSYLKYHMVEFRAITEDRDKFAKHIVRQDQLGIFNSPGHTDLGNTSWNISCHGDVLDPNSGKSMSSSDGQMCSNMPEETSDATELKRSCAVSHLSRRCSSEIETEHKDKGDGDTELVISLIKQIKEKDLILDKAYQQAQEDVAGEVSIAHLEKQKGCVAYEECLNQKMEEDLEPENKRKQRENSVLAISDQEFKDKVQDLYLTWEEMVKDLQQEKEMLRVQLRVQEQLMKDVQEQKTASDSVTSEVQSLFGQQLAILQKQRDHMQAQVDSQKARNKTLSELLGQKAVLENLLLKEQEDFKLEINKKEQSLSCLLKEKSTLEENLVIVGESLTKAEEALEESINKIMILEQTVDELNVKIKTIEESHEFERLEFEKKLKSSNSEVQKLSTEMILKEKEFSEDVAFLKNVQLKVETRLEETLQKSVQNIEVIQCEMRRLHKGEISTMESRYQSELADLKLQHQKTTEELNAEIRERMEQQQQIEADRKEETGIIKKVHEREHDREICELIIQHEDEIKELHTKLMKEQQQMLDELQQQIEAQHQEEMQQAEALHNLKLEALKLSSSNMHTSQLELMQTNLRKEKETALMELREMLNDKHAQEVAVLQGRFHFDLERITEQHDKEKEEMALQHQFDMDKQKKEIALEMEKKHTQLLESLKKEWASNTDLSLKTMSEELSLKHQIELNEMKTTLKTEVDKVKGKLKSLSFEKDQTEMEHENFKNQFDLAMTKLQIEHGQKLEDMKEQSKKQEGELQQEIENLKAIQEKLKAESEEEIKHLWSQLDSARSSRQELSELKEQLLARTSHMEEMEYLKKDFQLKWDKKRSEHENELEQLRLYFEQKLKFVEENYREELTMLHQRLQEMKDYSLLEMENSQDLHVEFGPSTTLLEEMTEKERHDLFEQLTQQLERHKEEFSCLQLHMDNKHRSDVELLRSSLSLQYQESLMKMKMDLSDRYTSEIEQLKRKHCLGLEQLRATMSEEHLKEIAKLRLQSAQDAARQVEVEVAERLLVLENDYKAQLNILQFDMQSISMQKEEIEKLKRENTKFKEMSVCQEKHLKELEQIKCKLIEDHANMLKKTREELQEMEQTHKTKAEEWKQEQEDLRRMNEEKLSLLCKELESKAEYERQALQKQFEFREAEMVWLQEQQATKIVELEKSLKEQQDIVQQLEETLVNTQAALAQCENELTSTKALMTEESEKAKEALQEEWKAKLKEAQSRFVEEGEAITEKITREHHILLQDQREKHIEELKCQSKELQHKHKEQILSLTFNLQTKHQAEIETLRSALERKQQTLEASISDTQNNHQAQITELETMHLSNLDTLESAYLSEIQLLQDEHRQALGDLRLDFREQLLQKDKENQVLLTQELDGMELKHAEKLQICQDNLEIELTTVHIGKLKLITEELQETHKEDLTIALEKQRCLLEDYYHKALDAWRGEMLHIEEQHKKAMQELQDLHVVEVKKEKEKCQHLQKEVESDKELEEKIKSLNKEIEDAKADLKNLLQQRNRENQEGETLIALLRSDMDVCRNERKNLQESYHQALKLLLKVVKATKDSEDLICKKVGLCLDDSLASGDSGESQNTIGERIFVQNRKTIEKWGIRKSNRGKVLDQTLPERSFDPLVPDEVSELSEHLCESIFENPDLVFENEEGINKICHCLHVAVEMLLELVVESTKQLEETHKIHIHFEEELKCRNWEACQVANEHHEPMDCLNEENEAKNNLMLEFHKARGLMEGYLTERHALEEALNLKEESERSLVAELENLKAQVQELMQKHVVSIEEQKLLISQNKALAANVGEREVALLKEVEHLAKAKLELQCQAEKDCSTLNSQMKILEMELEEQLNKNQKMTSLSLEVADLRQQIQALERQLKNQRDFMDKQAIEREHERDEFQEEIQKLEKQLKATTKFQASEQSREYVAETLHSEIRERMEDYNVLLLDKEQIQKDLAVQQEEIEKLEARVRELEYMNREEGKNVNKLTQELQKMKRKEAELKQDKEALQQQQYNNLIQISSLQSKLDEVKHRVLTEDSLDHILMEQLKAQEELTTKRREVANLSELLKQWKETVVNKNEEILQLSSQLEEEENVNVTKIIQLQDENAHLKENIEKLTTQSQNPGSSELVILPFLKSLIEEKNEENNNLNEQIKRLEQKIENSKENEVLKKQVLEIEDLKSVIEYLHGDKEQLLKDKTEEIEQLHRVIEKLQNELALLEPMFHEVSDNQDNLHNIAVVEVEEILHNKLKKGSPTHLESRDEGDNCLLLNSSQKQHQGQLEILLTDRETWKQLLEEKESQFKAEIKTLEQNLQNVQKSSGQHFTELAALQLQHKELQEEYNLLKMCLAQKESEMTVTTSCIQELEDKLRDKEVKPIEREIQFQIVSEQKVEQAVEVKHVKENVVPLENELHVFAQTLHDKEVTYQREISELKAAVAELKSQIEKNMEDLEAVRTERDLFHSQLKSNLEKDQNNESKEMKLHKLVPEPDAYITSKEIEEEGEERESSKKLLGSAEFSYSDELEKCIAMTNLKTSSENLEVQDKNLRSMLLVQRAEITNTVKEQDLQPLFQQMLQLNNVVQSTQFIQKISENFESMVVDESSWESPEIMRKQSNSMELQTSLLLTPFSEVDVIHSIGFESFCSDSSVIQSDISRLLECPVSYSNGCEETAANLLKSQHSSPNIPVPVFPGPVFSVTEYNGVQENISVKDAEGFTLLLSKLQDDLRSTMSRLEGARTEYGNNKSSDLVLQLNEESLETMVHQDSSAMAYLQCFGVVPDVTEPAMKEREEFSQHLKNALKMVYEESYKILVLSEKSVNDNKKIQKSPSKEGCQKERLALLDTIQSLKDYLNKEPDKEDKEKTSPFFDWRRELLQAVQCVLEKERNMLQSYLQAHFYNPGSGDEGSFMEKLEQIAEQQERQQNIFLEHLLSSDRNSLLTEIQDLEARLRLMHLQSQEKLQELQETLINTENHRSKQEHQLRRQVELLEYNLQQEKSIASDLQTSLKREQEKAFEKHELLKQEHTAILNLKSDLCESKQTNERLQKSLQELQKDVIKYSSALENKEKGMRALLQDLQNEQLKEKELQKVLDEQQHQDKIKEEEKSKAIQELQAALELQCIQNNQLSVALEHEQSANSNLRKELQIEHSRCEALLSQDQNKLLELQKDLDIEKNRSLELLSALNHERVLTEQLSMKINECGSCKHKDLLQELKTQLYKERSHVRELSAIIEKTQQQVLDSKKQGGQMQIYTEQPQKEQDLCTSSQVAQSQKQDIILALEIKRDIQMREQENRTEQGIEGIRQEQQTECDKLKELQRARESPHELELQHWQNSGRIKELQQMLEHLKEQEKYLNYHKNQDKLPSWPSKNNYNNLTFTTDTIMLHVERQKLENIREQLLIAVGYLSEFVYKTIDRTFNWPPSDDEAVAALVHILEELKAELLASSKSPIIPTCLINSMQESEEMAHQEEKPILHSGLKATEYEATKNNFVAENKSTMSPSSLKMQKLYRKYLRAESFRKALVYQKKYLLLLLGGFQECEQATLSLIARMGIYPSPPDLNVSESRSRSFTKFRSAVRMVIAILRLKFLVKKWHKVGRKEMPLETVPRSAGHNSYTGAGREVLKQQEPFPGDTTQEAGYCNKSNLMGCWNCSPLPSHQLHNKLV